MDLRDTHPDLGNLDHGGSPRGIPHKLGTHGSGARNGISQKTKVGEIFTDAVIKRVK